MDDLPDQNQARRLHDAKRSCPSKRDEHEITIEYKGRLLEHSVYREQEQHQAKIVPSKLLQPSAARVAAQPKKRDPVPMSHPWRNFDFSEKSMLARERRGELCILRK